MATIIITTINVAEAIGITNLIQGQGNTCSFLANIKETTDRVIVILTVVGHVAIVGVHETSEVSRELGRRPKISTTKGPT